ncbi:gas vesicle protein GvpJ [Desulfosporosinus sp. BICA1-9]|uniref:gas vesicle protein GvpJ n=1 Tax=Desulfosporosinus sp. BICA1-9 TaxID=1531958 RepID=UPI00054C12B2|nr:gas vesicle protein GvpJ [Desulfosporosinus sp. BICA1-9]KJS90313.1 MAG: gas vesicle synthesis protein GvpA [Desulfosporosinus sp. BICA1-9]HBW38550.1 gas vesicle synthesis protein GvpA [Desulfosporosinus sp.]
MALSKSVESSSLAEVIDRILDKGIVIDAFVRISLVGIELITIEARIVIASVDTYLKYASAIGLTLTGSSSIMRN